MSRVCGNNKKMNNAVEGGVHRVAKEGFDQQTESYARGRPEYPGEEVERVWNSLGLHADARVLDLASGTGKLTKPLLALAKKDKVKIVAVEPSQGMRKRFAQDFPEVECVDGTADAIPFEASSFHAIFAGQAFHWFATESALRELHRALVPGGHLVLVWNLEDASVPWIRLLRNQYEAYEGSDTPQFHKMLWRQIWNTPLSKELFDVVHDYQVPYFPQATKQSAWDRIISKSYVSILPEAEQKSLKERCDKIINDAFQDHDAIPYPQLTTFFIAKKK